MITHQVPKSSVPEPSGYAKPLASKKLSFTSLFMVLIQQIICLAMVTSCVRSSNVNPAHVAKMLPALQPWDRVCPYLQELRMKAVKAPDHSGMVKGKVSWNVCPHSKQVCDALYHGIEWETYYIAVRDIVSSLWTVFIKAKSFKFNVLEQLLRNCHTEAQFNQLCLKYANVPPPPSPYGRPPARPANWTNSWTPSVPKVNVARPKKGDGHHKGTAKTVGKKAKRSMRTKTKRQKKVEKPTSAAASPAAAASQNEFQDVKISVGITKRMALYNRFKAQETVVVQGEDRTYFAQIQKRSCIDGKEWVVWELEDGRRKTDGVFMHSVRPENIKKFSANGPELEAEVAPARSPDSIGDAYAGGPVKVDSRERTIKRTRRGSLV